MMSLTVGLLSPPSGIHSNRAKIVLVWHNDTRYVQRRVAKNKRRCLSPSKIKIPAASMTVRATMAKTAKQHPSTGAPTSGTKPSKTTKAMTARWTEEVRMTFFVDHDLI